MKTKYKYLLGFSVFVLIIWSSMETKISYSNITQLKLTSKEIELDTIKKKSFERYNLQVVKKIGEPLYIAKIETSTESINIQKTLQYFQKGDTISIPLVFHAKTKVGNIKEYITLHGNFPEKEIIIPVSGYIK